MKICPECARSYANDAVVCAYDGTPLSTGSTQGWDPTASAEPKVGDVLGAYRILGQIGAGGMGVIYRAEHVRLGRKVAIKLLLPELAKRADVVSRFFEEARAVNEIGHPNILDIIDFVEKCDESPPLVYMVQELLQGQDLASRIRSAGPLEPEEVVGIALQVTDALIAVHRVKILHRDLKPENIFLVPREDVGTVVKLLDFGVAKAFGQRQKVSITDPGTAVGTPEYMAPEQILGRELDDRTDIYALGLVLYDMLTNTVPFQSSAYGEVLIAQVKEQPEPISTRRRSGTPVPAALDALVMRCLRKDPAERYQTMREVKVALKACMPGYAFTTSGSLPVLDLQPDLAPAAGIPTQLVETPRRQRRSALILGIALALILGAGGLLIWLLRGTEAPDKTAAVRSPEVARPARSAGLDGGPRSDASGPAAIRPDTGAKGLVAQPARKSKRVPKVGTRKAKKRRHGLEGTVDPFAR